MANGYIYNEGTHAHNSSPGETPTHTELKSSRSLEVYKASCAPSCVQ